MYRGRAQRHGKSDTLFWWGRSAPAEHLEYIHILLSIVVESEDAPGQLIFTTKHSKCSASLWGPSSIYVYTLQKWEAAGGGNGRLFGIGMDWSSIQIWKYIP